MLSSKHPMRNEMLKGIQGNILKAHGRHHTANLFITGEPEKQSEVKAWIRSLTEGKNPIISSGAQQILSIEKFRKEGEDSGPFGCFHISAAGYKYLFGQERADLFGDDSFKDGMANANLNDPPLAMWDEGLQKPHFMLLLADTSEDRVRSVTVEIQKSIMFCTKVTSVVKGHAVFNGKGAGIEHFGYVDGVSQPLFFQDEWEKYKLNNSIIDESKDIVFDPRAKPELVLVPDPLITGDPNAMGSYFVFRKLEQNVKGFKLAEAALAVQLGLEGEEEERIGAQVIGRFEDGSPVQVVHEEGQMPNSAVFNNFDYDSEDASKCPFHAHIRKTNPRSDLPKGEAAKRRMARRGIPFGIRNDDPEDGLIDNKPEGDVGLLFMSYQASIVDQFEFIQKNWANNSNFSKPNTGLDLIIGQGGQEYPIKWGDPTSMRPATFGQFVQMKGGEYFFAPSMRFLQEIDEL